MTIEHNVIPDSGLHEIKGVVNAVTGQVLTCDVPGTSIWADPTGGAGTGDFDGLTDTPASKVGQAGRSVIVNQTEDALVYSATTPAITISTPTVAVGGELSIDVGFNYTVGQLDMYLNGVQQTRTLDFSATDGTSAQLAEALVAGQIYEFRTINEVIVFISDDTLISLVDTPGTYGSAGQVLTSDGVGAFTLETPNTFFNKVDGTVAPTVNNDSTEGFQVGSMWIDVVADEAYRCSDPAVGAAVWLNTTLEVAETDLLYLKLSGGTLTGQLVMNSSNPNIDFNNTASGGGVSFIKQESDGSVTLAQAGNNKINMSSTGKVDMFTGNGTKSVHKFQFKEDGGEYTIHTLDGGTALLLDFTDATDVGRMMHFRPVGNMQYGIGSGSNSTGMIQIYGASNTEVIRVNSALDTTFLAGDVILAASNNLTVGGTATAENGLLVGRDQGGTTTDINKIWTGTQTEYNLLTPDNNTLYFIEE